jgi:hypothetical protein
MSMNDVMCTNECDDVYALTIDIVRDDDCDCDNDCVCDND